MNDIKLNKIADYAYSTRETIYNTYSLAKEMIEKEVPGVFVECGIAAGAQVMVLKYAIGDGDKKIYAFDSFEGIPLAGEFDTSQPGIGDIEHDKMKPLAERLISSGVTVHSKDNVVKNFQSANISLENVVFIKGWFQDTLPIHSKGISKISLLRLDGDLYESTFVCLKYLYPLVSSGGVIIIDDFALDGARKAVYDYFENKIPETITVDGGQGVAYFYKK